MAEENNGVKYLLVLQDLFDRTVNAKGMKTNQETVKAFSSTITKKNRPKKIWVDKGTKFAWAFKKFCAAEWYKFPLLWVRVRRLLLNVQSDHWKLFFTVTLRILVYIHNLAQFITTSKSRRNKSIDMRPNTLKNCDFMSILYSKTLREWKRHVFKTGEREQLSKYDFPFRKGYKPQFTWEVSEIVAIAKKNHQHTQSRMTKTRLFKATFIEKCWLKSFNNGLVYKRVGF